jgi:hypothetical protein
LLIVCRIVICNGIGDQGCNQIFPAPDPADNYCYVCNETNPECQLDGNALTSAHLKHCPKADDVCAMSFLVVASNPNSIIKHEERKSAFVRRCMTSTEAAKTKSLYEINDFAYYSYVTDNDTTDVHLFICSYPGCNRNFPSSEVDTAAPPIAAALDMKSKGLTCYTCSVDEDTECGENMTDVIRETSPCKCHPDPNSRCVMSFHVHLSGERFGFKRSCIIVTHSEHQSQPFYKPLIGRDPADGSQVCIFHAM